MKPSILYIEDEVDYQILVKKILGRAGYRVTTADSGEEGLRALEETPTDMLLLDINLPDANGYDLCASVRAMKTHRKLPILMLTVRRRPEEWLRGFSVGADDYLSKPFNPPELVERVTACVDGQTRRRFGNGAPEHQLIQAAVAGNRAAFEVLIRQNQDKLILGILRLGFSAGDAEEIVAQGFMYAFLHLTEFRGDASFYTWMYQVMRSTARKLRKHERTLSLDKITGETDNFLPDSLKKNEPIFDDLVESEHAALLPSMVAEVPQPYRRMLRWHVVKGMPYEKIAKKMHMPAGTVMSRLSKARSLLRDAWAKRTQR